MFEQCGRTQATSRRTQTGRDREVTMPRVPAWELARSGTVVAAENLGRSTHELVLRSSDYPFNALIRRFTIGLQWRMVQ